VQRVAINVGVDSNALNPHSAARPHNANSNFAAIGNENAPENQNQNLSTQRKGVSRGNLEINARKAIHSILPLATTSVFEVAFYLRLPFRFSISKQYDPDSEETW